MAKARNEAELAASKKAQQKDEELAGMHSLLDQVAGDVDELKEQIYAFLDHPIPSFVRQMAELKRELKRTNLQKRWRGEFTGAQGDRRKPSRSLARSS